MFFVGTSGFAYKDWKPRFYPAGTPQTKLLEQYATRLNSVEINYTFQRFPTEKLLHGWSSKVPDGFTFSLKTPRVITHNKRLRDCSGEMERFLAPARTLGEKLGAVLIQLPPTMVCDEIVLKDFLSLLPEDLRFAMEFRHRSWSCDSVIEALREHGVAWVSAESDDSEAIMHATAPFSYLRLRRSAYDDAAIRAWAQLIEEDAFVYLKHDADGANAVAAELLRRCLEGAGE
ncbi:MAG: DUF72 domain-containing protein [Actinomycetota bacterium]